MNLWTLLTILFIASADVRAVGQECQRSETRLTYNTEAGCASGTQTHDFCSPGKKIANRCEGECTYCGTGEYQNEYTDCSTCLKCTTEEDCCEGQEILTNCSSDRNAVCGCPPCTTITCPPSTTPDLPVEPSFQQNCPSNITIEAEEGATGSTVTWTEPVVSNASSAVQSHYPGSIFRIGYTDVFYAFSGSTGNMITCSFVINVKEAPRTTSTVDPVSTTTDQPEVSSRGVNPVPTTTDPPDKGGLNPHNDRVQKGWRILGIISVIVCFLLLLGYLILYLRLRKVPQPKGYDGIPPNDQGNYPPNNVIQMNNICAGDPPTNNGNDPAAGNDSQGSGPGGSGSTHDATPPEGSDQGPSPPQGAEGGDPSPGITSESSTNQEGMTSGPEADGGDVKLTVVLPTDESDQGPSSIQGSEGGDPSPGSQLQFSNAAIGNERITEKEINAVVDEVYQCYGTVINSLDRFFSRLGIPYKDNRRMQAETSCTRVNDILFDVIMQWHAEAPQTKEALRKGLYKNHEQLGIWYVGYVNDQENDQQ